MLGRKPEKSSCSFRIKLFLNYLARRNLNLDTQIRKAAVSITANISGGYGRYNYQEGIQFYRISRASLYELKEMILHIRIPLYPYALYSCAFMSRMS